MEAKEKTDWGMVMLYVIMIAAAALTMFMSFPGGISGTLRAIATM
jgi:hypothetical protein